MNSSNRVPSLLILRSRNQVYYALLEHLYTQAKKFYWYPPAPTIPSD